MSETLVAETTERAPVTYRSVSQVKQMMPEFGGCPYQYKLQRRDRAWQEPAAWLPQGTTVHDVIDWWEKGGRRATLAEVIHKVSETFSSEVSALTEDTPNLNFWFPRSGGWRRTVAEDLERRHHIAIQQVIAYIAFTERNPNHVPDDLNGRLASELEFRVHFGDVEVYGFIDQVVTGRPIDVKTGKTPGDDFQLGTYSGALLLLFDIEPTVGHYLMMPAVASKPIVANLTVGYDMTEWPIDRLADVYGRADEMILEERFDPAPEPKKCQMCPVRRACEHSLA